MTEQHPTRARSVMIIGAGPYGFTAATFLQAAGLEVSIHGVPMENWKEKMPHGMILRSSVISSSIASPGDALSIEQYERQSGHPVDKQPTIGQFIDYANWYLKKGVPQIQQTKARKLEREGDGFLATFEDGNTERADAVVLATGISPYPYVPEEFVPIAGKQCTHVSEHKSFAPFQGKSVAVVGKGQSALESAALLRESGAQVEILTRGPRLNFIEHRQVRSLWDHLKQTPPVHNFLYPPTDLAGPPSNWAIADPVLYRELNPVEREDLFELVGPIGSTNLEKRLAGVPVTTRVRVLAATLEGDRVCLALSDGTQRSVDHVLLGTGYHPDINGGALLSPELKREIVQENGYPVLSLGYESVSVKRLYVVGALACWSQGPINRFVCGTYPMGQYLTEAVTGSKIGYLERSSSWRVTGRRWLYRVYRTSRALGLF